MITCLAPACEHITYLNLIVSYLILSYLTRSGLASRIGRRAGPRGGSRDGGRLSRRGTGTRLSLGARKVARAHTHQG
jgi:hypothetical protein